VPALDAMQVGEDPAQFFLVLPRPGHRVVLELDHAACRQGFERPDRLVTRYLDLEPFRQ
jgi:hypothetical protein